MKKFFSSLFLIVIISSCADNNFDNSNEITVPVSVSEVKLKSIEQFIDATGTVKATKEATLYSESSGYYKLQKNNRTGKKFAIGDAVKAGEVIVIIDDPEYINSIRIDLKKLQLEQAKSEFEKQKSLYEKGGVTQTELKTSELNFIDQQYTYDNAKLQLDKMKIIAPFNGVIVDLPYYTEGVKINQGIAIATIMDYKKLVLEVNLPEKNLDEVKKLQTARVMNYTLQNDTLTALVTQISPAIDISTRTFKAQLLVDNPKQILRPGMFVKTEITTSKRDSAIVISKDIILTQNRGKIVYVVVKGASQKRVISTGLENPTEVEVTKGLKPNERIVVKGFETLKDRQKVKIIK